MASSPGGRGAERNAAYLADMVEYGSASEEERANLVDPQTSGGLLVAVPPARVAEYLSRGPGAAEIGAVLPGGPPDAPRIVVG